MNKLKLSRAQFDAFYASWRVQIQLNIISQDITAQYFVTIFTTAGETTFRVP